MHQFQYKKFSYEINYEGILNLHILERKGYKFICWFDENGNEWHDGVLILSEIMKTQTFIDGNKRTAVIFGDHYLISHGVGLMVVPVEKIEKYKTLLLDYYEDRSEDLIEFFVKECFISLV